MGETAVNKNKLLFQDYSSETTTNIWEYLPVRVHGKSVCKAIEVIIETLIYLALAMDQFPGQDFTNDI